jgi:N utilization substance protein B
MPTVPCNSLLSSSIMNTPLAVRREARTLALKTLFEVDCAGHNPSESFDRLMEDSSLSEQTTDFIRNLVLSVLDNRRSIDELIQRYAPAWPLQQLSIIDRNILRLAVHELLSETAPAKVAINEAVELAKVFGSDSSPKFVNGVLGSVYADLASQKQKTN